MSASDLQRKAFAVQGLPPRPLVPSLHSATRPGASKQRYAPKSWSKYFDDKRSCTLKNGDSFNYYSKGNSGPLFLLLHGGGYSGLTWACFAKEMFELLDCSILAPDLRGHGDSKTNDESDLSVEVQGADVSNIIQCVYGDNCPPVFLIGHSMGGAVAIHVAYSKLLSSLIGLSVIDVVEGSAMEALRGMQTFLMSRPNNFKSVEAAIEWCIRSSQTRNVEAACVSMPSQLKPVQEDPMNVAAAADEMDECLEESAELNENDNKNSGKKSVSDQAKTSYTWRIDLKKTEPYWEGWFKGLSSKFLAVEVPKLLLLAGVDRLDRELTTGQMQGKFQMIVLPKVGHAVQEDSPTRVAEVYATFCVRNKFAVAKASFQPVFPGC